MTSASQTRAPGARRRPMPAAIPRTVGAMTALLGLLIVPLWAHATIALAPLDDVDHAPLWGMSTILVGLGIAAVRTRSPRLTAVLLPILIVGGIETGTRTWARIFCSDTWIATHVALADRTYPERAAYVGHPFLQFVGRPHRALLGTDVLGTAGLNDLGFVGPNVTLEKPDDVVRIAFLGGSTTATGYFRAAERRLNELAKDTGKRFECVSFAMGYYTSAHSVVNFALNALDYRPDYVVFHHGWNDLRANGHPDDFRGDYSHAFKAFDPPTPPDVWLIRGSLVYRFLAHRLAPKPPWADLGGALHRPHRRGNAQEQLARTYLRNVNTVVELANSNSIVPVLVTQGHSKNPEIAFSSDAPGIAAFSILLRQAAAGYGDRALLVDLDALTTGQHEEFFRDVGHHLPAGVRFKGHTVADAIWAHWSGR